MITTAMRKIFKLKRNVIFACLFLGPLFQLIGDSLWASHTDNYAWTIWRQFSYIFFIPAGILFAKVLEPKSLLWAVIACGLFIIGCFGSAAMMPLFRLGAFYPTKAHYEFPEIVQSVLDKRLFAVTLFPPGLCLPVSLIVFGVGFLKHRLLNVMAALGFILSGVLFFTGNALEQEAALVIGDILLLTVFCYAGYLIYKGEKQAIVVPYSTYSTTELVDN
jgi:hypothetical protein